MSDAKNLNDFFAQQSKKKKNKKTGQAGKAQPAATAQVVNEEVKNDPVAAQPEAQTTPAQDFADSSDEESNTIVINEGRKKIIDRKDLEASKKKEEEEDATAGWGLGSKLGQVEENTTSKPSVAAPAKGAGGMSFGKPMFTRKQKGIMDNQDFPDLDAAANKTQATESKANSAMSYSFGAAAKGARDPDAPEEEKRVEAKKPVFKGKAKLNTGIVQENTGAGSMSYDFSKMNMSAATTKKTEGADGQSKPDGERRRPAPPSFNDDDDFEVVKEKVKAPRENRRPAEEPRFGGGMPSFSRGGANAK